MKRDIDLQRIPTAIGETAKSSVNKGLPIDNKTLSEIEEKDTKLYESLRKGTAKLRIFRDE
jgi:hypothetical protein